MKQSGRQPEQPFTLFFLLDGSLILREGEEDQKVNPQSNAKPVTRTERRTKKILISVLRLLLSHSECMWYVTYTE